MSLRTTRLTFAEWMLGAGAILLLVDFFAAIWFAYTPHLHAIMSALGQATSANGWDTFTVLDPLTLIVCVASIAVLLLTATRASPAVPVVITTLLLPISFVQAVLIGIRVLLDRPSVNFIAVKGSAIETRPGAYIGLALSVVIFAGVYLSMRRDAVPAEDSPAVIETLSSQNSATESPA